MPEEKETEQPKKVNWYQRGKSAWGAVTFVVTVMGTLIGGYVWIDNTLDAYEQRGVDIDDLKRSNQEILGAQQRMNKAITDNMNATRESLRDEFHERDLAARALDARITAVLNEMRARHGVVPLAGESSRRVQVRRLAAETEAAGDRAEEARPSDDPLSGLDF